MNAPRLSTTLVTPETIPAVLRAPAEGALTPAALRCHTHAETPRRFRSPTVVDMLYVLDRERFTVVTATRSGTGKVSTSVRDLRVGVSVRAGGFTLGEGDVPSTADASISVSGFWVGGTLNDRGSLRILLEGNEDGRQFRERLLALSADA